MSVFHNKMQCDNKIHIFNFKINAKGKISTCWCHCFFCSVVCPFEWPAHTRARAAYLTWYFTRTQLNSQSCVISNRRGTKVMDARLSKVLALFSQNFIDMLKSDLSAGSEWCRPPPPERLRILAIQFNSFHFISFHLFHLFNCVHCFIDKIVRAFYTLLIFKTSISST